MGFSDDLNRFGEKVERIQRDIVVEHATIMHESVTKGSPITGAPGQPVDTGNLLNSWQLTFQGSWQAETSTSVVYAPVIEDAIGLTLRSEVGGFHSVALTRAANQRMADAAARRVVG